MPLDSQLPFPRSLPQASLMALPLSAHEVAGQKNPFEILIRGLIVLPFAQHRHAQYHIRLFSRCASCDTLPVTYAMMHAPMSTEAEHQAWRR